MSSEWERNNLELIYSAAGIMRKVIHSKNGYNEHMAIGTERFRDLLDKLNMMELSIDMDIRYCDNLLKQLRSGSHNGQPIMQI